MRPAAKLFFFYWLPVIAWAAFIFFASSRPGLKVAEGIYDFLTRKPVHIVEYLILALLFSRAFFYGLGKESNQLSPKVAIVSSFVLSLIYAASDEIHQIFVPLREGKISDVFFDGIGSLVGVFLSWRLFQNQKKKQDLSRENLPKI